MYKVRSVTTDKATEIVKLLKEGWEPMLVVGEESKRRMYFRLWEQEIEVAELKESEPVKLDGDEFAVTFNKIMTEWANSFFDRLAEIMKSSYTETKFNAKGGLWVPGSDRAKALKAKTEDETEDREDEEATDDDFEILSLIQQHTIPDLLEIAMEENNIEIDDLRGMNKRELTTFILMGRKKGTDEGVAVRATDAPDGDGFRVIDEIPAELNLTGVNNRTPQQDATIEALKKQNDSVSILPGNEGGSVRVLVGADIYIISPAGNFTVQGTGANTNALG